MHCTKQLIQQNTKKMLDIGDEKGYNINKETMGIFLKKSEKQKLRDICKQHGFSFRDMITVYIRYGLNHTNEIIRDGYES